MSGEQCEQRLAQSPITGAIYRVTEFEDKGDGKLVAENKEEIGIEDVPDTRVCDYCESNLAVEWSDQGKRQCMMCSPRREDWT